MKDAINIVGDRMGLPNGLINTDFERTVPYSPRLVECSQYYRTFSSIVTIRKRELTTRDHLIEIEKKYPKRLTENNLDDVIQSLSTVKENSKSSKTK